MKAVPTLVSLALPAVVVEDPASVELDVAALERGYTRPGPPPRAPVDVRVVDLASIGAVRS